MVASISSEESAGTSLCLYFVSFASSLPGQVVGSMQVRLRGDATLPGFCNSPLKSWYQTITSFPHTDSGLNTDGHSGT